MRTTRKELTALATSQSLEVKRIELPDGRAVSTSACNLQVWDLSKPEGDECVVTLSGHEDGVETVTELPDGRLVSGSNDGILKVWDLSKDQGNQCIATLDGHEYRVVEVIVLPNDLIISRDSREIVRFWDLTNGEEL